MGEKTETSVRKDEPKPVRVRTAGRTEEVIPGEMVEHNAELCPKFGTSDIRDED